ncbi:MAG: acetyl-CoA carboxylase biotin carboxyl carrier protein [Ruminococcus flavefaciens]|nr:acetyl-CoA carboxylase biotin carboxyl carrier protein [Ruminococcus flavefaciens]MCM1231214.1 acetyl-CoA carboxylase biotin carboxyl carrier protein [Ruminococcus flavefaciens]
MEDKIFNVNIETIEKLAEIVSKNELSEITINVSDCNLTIKGKKPQPAPPVMPVPMGMPAPVQTAPAPSAVEENVPRETDGNVVKAPIVGTFYQSPSPDKPPFVKVGDTVKKGDVIMIIESMKLMNEVQSEFDGTVAKILVGDGQAVEFDQPIMIIK